MTIKPTQPEDSAELIKLALEHGNTQNNWRGDCEYVFSLYGLQTFATALAAPSPQPAATASAPSGYLTSAQIEAYDLIDRFLRNNLDDADYSEFSDALEMLISTPAPAAPSPQQATTKEAGGESIHVESVATVVLRDDGLDLDWLIEGGIAALECEGVVLYIAERPITDDNGSGEVYLAAAPQPAEARTAAASGDAKDAEILVTPWALYIGEGDSGPIVERYGSSNGKKHYLYTQDQMRAAIATREKPDGST